MITKVSLNEAGEASTRRVISNISSAVAKSKKIVVVTGAGISCSCGIPDFRSSDGLYSLVKQQYPDVVLKGRDLFDSSLFRDAVSTSLFYTFISKLKQSIDDVSPSATHTFIKTLDMKGKLLRSYTQNIDGLEERVGLLGSSSSEAKAEGKSKSKLRLKDVKNVQLHGDIRRVRCMLCSAELPFASEYASIFDDGMAPECPECLIRSEERVARSARPLKIGNLRPAIVLYDEPHPLGDDIGAIETSDLARKPDMLIIMGTSLKVHGLKKLVKEFAKAVHASSSGKKDGDPVAQKKGSRKVIFVNKTPPASEWEGIIDFHVEGETDEWVTRVIDDWKKLRPADWEVQTKLIATGSEIGGPFKVAKETIGGKSKASKVGKNHSRKPNDLENIPPTNIIDSLKLPQSSSLPTITVPLSPSKRRQVASHYSDTECSPSKKPASIQSCKLLPEERGLLFGPSKRANVVTEVNLSEDIFGEMNPASAKSNARTLVIETSKSGRTRATAKLKTLELSAEF